MQCLIVHYGKNITKAHAKQLTKLKITHQILASWSREESTSILFKDRLRRMKVYSADLRERLGKFYYPHEVVL